MRTTKALTSLRICAVWSASLLFAYLKVSIIFATRKISLGILAFKVFFSFQQHLGGQLPQAAFYYSAVLQLEGSADSPLTGIGGCIHLEPQDQGYHKLKSRLESRAGIKTPQKYRLT